MAARIPAETLNTLAVTWANMQTFQQNGPIVAYNVYAQQNESICPTFEANVCVAPYLSTNQTVVATQVLGNTTTDATLGGLVSGVNYKVWVQAVGKLTLVSPNSSFDANWSTQPEPPSGAPQNDTVAVRGVTGVVVAWELPLGPQRNGPITSYEVEGESCATASCADCSLTYSQTVSGTVTSHQLTALPSHTYIRVQIAAGTPGGNSTNHSKYNSWSCPCVLCVYV